MQKLFVSSLLIAGLLLSAVAPTYAQYGNMRGNLTGGAQTIVTPQEGDTLGQNNLNTLGIDFNKIAEFVQNAINKRPGDLEKPKIGKTPRTPRKRGMTKVHPPN